MKKVIQLCLLIITINTIAQETNPNHKIWSETDHLKIDDFQLKIENNSNRILESQFTINYESQGFDFLKRNLNHRVQNIFIKNASWIDVSKTDDIQYYLDYHQVQFDLSEVYARELRKSLLFNKKKISRGFSEVKKLHDEILAELAIERTKLNNDTNFGNDKEKLKVWKKNIQNKLVALYEFRLENTKKIKIKK
ncbi:hypothetical protein [Tenacibaculum geojense]|uniref:DUF4468 domain-containing protein n=1 Tax=Tenacibaculum geojense TaxID=915352 RepID=A0ABW3JSR7_9FLAO